MTSQRAVLEQKLQRCSIKRRTAHNWTTGNRVSIILDFDIMATKLVVTMLEFGHYVNRVAIIPRLEHHGNKSSQYWTWDCREQGRHKTGHGTAGNKVVTRLELGHYGNKANCYNIGVGTFWQQSGHKTGVGTLR